MLEPLGEGADFTLYPGHRVQLQQVLMNLMINGIDAMKDMNGARGAIFYFTLSTTSEAHR